MDGIHKANGALTEASLCAVPTVVSVDGPVAAAHDNLKIYGSQVFQVSLNGACICIKSKKKIALRAGLGFRSSGLMFGGSDLGFRVWSLGFGFSGLSFRGSGFGV